MRSADSLRAFLDRCLLMLEDALDVLPVPDRWMREPVVKPGQAPPENGLWRLEIDPSNAFLARLDIETKDPLEARRAFALQSDRLSPLDRQMVDAGLVRNGDGAWTAAIVRKTDLHHARDLQGGSDRLSGFLVPRVEGPPILVRDAAAKNLWRRYTSLCLALSLALLFALVWFSSALADRSARTAAVELAALRGQTQAVREANLAVTGQATDASIAEFEHRAVADVLAVLAQLKPAEWRLLTIRLDNADLVALLEHRPEDGGLGSNLTDAESWAEIGFQSDIRPVGFVGGLQRLELRVHSMEQGQ